MKIKGWIFALLCVLVVMAFLLVMEWQSSAGTATKGAAAVMLLAAVASTAFYAGDRRSAFLRRGGGHPGGPDSSCRMLMRIPDAVFCFRNQELIFVNESGSVLLGADSLSAFSYSGFCNRIHLEDREGFAWQPQPGEKGSSRIEARYCTTGELYRECEFTLSRTTDKSGCTLLVIVRDLSEQKQLSKQLEDAKQISQDILRYQQGITFKYTYAQEQELLCTFWEGELAYEIGLPPAAALNLAPEAVFDAPAAIKLRIYCDTAREETEPLAFETVLMNIPCQVMLHPFGRSGDVIEVVGYCTNISLRKATEAELMRTKELMESFFNNTSDAIDVSDLNGRIMLTNPAFVGMFGLSYEECIGKNVLEMVPSDLHEEVQNLHEAVEYGGHISGYETKRLRHNGELFDVSVTISPIRSSTGETIAIAAISRDITDSKQVEAALRKSETKYRLITENMTDIIGVLNYRGKIEYISPSTRSMLGMEPEQVMGQSVFDWLHPEDRSQISEFFKKSLTTGIGEVGEIRIKHSEGHWIVLEVSSRWMADHNMGDLPNILLVARDVTERKKAEELMVKSEKLSVVGQLAAGVAHEIRNPLTSLKGFLQLLQKRTNENGFFFELMLSELDRINNIVSEFLVLSKPQAVKFERSNLVGIVQVVISFLSSQALLSNVQIIACIQTESEVLVDCDENQLKQVFINLLKNALEAMPHGGTITVTVRQSASDKVLIQFEDQGQGIPPERIPKLGEPFYTTKEKGTGLGLMVTFRIIHDHGGTVRVRSQLGIGTVFDVELPVVPARVQE
ncbi:MAG: hypothetical protein K0R57_6481 [Paenibacillaceae bacterium]|nr:hypothetical protein [Paenibacillaceae bacterium]